ncbi:zinc finger, CCHC-type containing protein [Tanacetum coccineum]
MVVAAMKYMASNFSKLDKFEGVDFRRWQKKMHFLLSSISVVYVLTTPMPKDGGDDETMKQIRKRAKWDNDDYVCRGLILNGLSDSLFDIYQNVESYKELWDFLEAKYMAEDASSKKFLVSNFINYKMTDSRLVLEQCNELLGILRRFTQHMMNMDEAIQVSCIIDKLSPSWNDFKHTLKHLKEELTLVELGGHLRIEESLMMHDSDKPKGNNVAGPSVVNMMEHNNNSRYNDNKGKRKHHDNIKADPNKKSKMTCWKCGKPGHLKKDCKGGKVGNKANGSGTNGSVDGSTNSLKAYFVQDDDVAWWVDLGATVYHVILGHVHFKRMQDMLKDGLIPAFDMDTEKCKTCMLTKITKKPFQNVKRETKVLELIHSDLCDLHATPSLGNKNYFVTFIDDASRTESRVLGCQTPDPKLKSLVERGIKCIFVGYVEHSKAFRFSSLPIPSLTISNRTEDTGGSVVPEEVTEEVDLTREFFSTRFSMEDMGEADVILGIRIKHGSNGIAISQSYYNEKALKKFSYFDCTPMSSPMDTSEKLMPNNDQPVSQLEYSRVIGCLMYAMTCTKPDIAFVVGKLVTIRYFRSLYDFNLSIIYF